MALPSPSAARAPKRQRGLVAAPASAPVAAPSDDDDDAARVVYALSPVSAGSGDGGRDREGGACAPRRRPSDAAARLGRVAERATDTNDRGAPSLEELLAFADAGAAASGGGGHDRLAALTATQAPGGAAETPAAGARARASARPTAAAAAAAAGRRARARR